MAENAVRATDPKIEAIRARWARQSRAGNGPVWVGKILGNFIQVFIDIDKLEATRYENWPSDNKPADFEELSTPIIDSIRVAYDLTRTNIRDIPYRGFEHNELHHCHGISDSLTHEIA